MKKLIVSSLVGLFLAACGGPTFSIRGTERAVGADADVTIEEQEGGNRLVKLQVRHLTPPRRLDKSLKTYVVWFQGGDNQPAQAVGTLDYDADSRTGEMEATTVHRNFDVLVTAEVGPSVTVPSDHAVFLHRVGK